MGAVYACHKSICGHSEDCTSSDESFCLQVKIQWSQAEGKKIPTPSHLITNLAYKLKPIRQETSISEQDWTHADMDFMPASVYKLVFNDHELKKLAPSDLEIGTYTTDTLKIVGSCLFYLVHQTQRSYKKLAFMKPKMMGSVLLSCTWTYTTAHKIGLFTSQS